MIDPTLAAARGPYGDPRFYSPGGHPALREYQRHLRDLLVLRARLRAAEMDTTVTDDCIDYVRDRVAAFEEGESIAKADYLRTVER